MSRVTKLIGLNPILSLIAVGSLSLVLSACGLRGPLTVNPPSIKGLVALPGGSSPQSASIKATPSNTLADPSAAVLVGADGQRVPVQAKPE